MKSSPNIQDFVRLHFARIHRAALVMSGNPWDADDLAQETFLIAARTCKRFRRHSREYTWLYGILLNLQRRRRRNHRMAASHLRVVWDEAQQRLPAADGSSVPIEVNEWKNSLWSHVDRLPDGQRDALVLRFSEGLTYDQIAEVLGCPAGTAKSRVHHGLAALQRILTPIADDLQPPSAVPHKGCAHVI